MSRDCKWPKYPRAWPKISRTIRRLAGGRCQQCGTETPFLSVHHIGVPYADGRPGNPEDKHDCRRENLLSLCGHCHDELENVSKIAARKRMKRQRRAARLEAHRSLGIGTGLVLVKN